MISGENVSGIDLLHPSPFQSIEFFEGVEVLGDGFAFDLDFHRVETEGFPWIQGDENGHLGVRGIKQFLFQLVKSYNFV